MRLQQAQHLPVQLGVVARRAVEITHLLVGGQIEQCVEDRVDAAVAVGWRRGHQFLASSGKWAAVMQEDAARSLALQRCNGRLLYKGRSPVRVAPGVLVLGPSLSQLQSQ